MGDVVSIRASVKNDRATGTTPDFDFLSLAKRRFRTAMDAESELRDNMLADLEFRASEQWDQKTKSDRTAEGKPSLTINRIPQFIRQVTNQARASRPAIQVNPIDSGADPATAMAIQGVMRAIEVNSDADIAYSTGCDHQATCGRGWWRVLTEWASDDGYEQNIVIKRIADPLSVVPDPASIEVDGRDMRYCFVFEDMPKDEFIEEYGEDAASSYEAWAQTRDRSPEWMPEGRVRVAEYYYVETHTETIVDLRLPRLDGQGTEVIRCLESDVPKERPEDWAIENKRTIARKDIYWSKITPTVILDGNDGKTAGRKIPGRWIPVVQVIGDEIIVGGKRDLRGMVRDAKDPQRMYSYWASCLTEIITQAPRAPYIGFAGQFKGHEAKWNLANRKNFSYLEVNPITAGGQPVSLPQRQQFSPEINSIVEAFRLADNDLKAVMGLFDASLGENGPEQSGKAILARQRQGELGNSNFLDNLGRAIRHTGRIILSMMPSVYTPIRIMKILGADDKPDNAIFVNGAQDVDVQAAKAATGIQKIYDISVGRYDVSISVGPSYLSRRQEAVSAMLDLIKAYPQAAPVVADLLVKNMDWPGSAEIAARLKRAVPPNLLAPGEEGFDPIPPPVKAQIEQIQQAFAELKQQIDAKVLELGAKASAQLKDIESRERIAKMQSDSNIMVAEVKAHFDAVTAQMKQENDAVNQRLQVLHEAQQAAADREHEAQLEVQRLEAEAEQKKQEQQAQASAPSAGAQPS